MKPLQLSLLALLLTLLWPRAALALPAISCHCFQDRSFDRARPAAADPYFRATVQNRLLARTFETSRKKIVLAKQTGTANADLWIALRAAGRSGRDVEELLALKTRRGTWRTALGEPETALGLPAGAAAADDGALARAVAEQVLLEAGLAEKTALAVLRREGCGLQDTLLAVLLGAARGQPAGAQWQKVKTGGRSWGELLAEAGFAAEPDRLLDAAAFRGPAH